MDGGATEDAGAGSFAILGGLERWRAYWSIGAWSLVLCGSVLLNATLLVAFIRRPGLRTISNRFVMNLIGSNLLAIIVLSALLIMGSCGITSLRLSSGAASLCALSEGATALVTSSSILSVLLIGVDQYLAVVDPLRYRTRIDKLKCGLLILAVWLLSLAFGLLASLNPEPRSLRFLCAAKQQPARETVRLHASILLSGSNDSGLEIDGELSFAEPGGLAGLPSYGLVYALGYALLGYLLPFLGICWIYASIYRAARNNSERTRRTGSRPVLSSGSFSEEGAPSSYQRSDCSVEDFRRIPKISSLSSIDENSEATASQLGGSPSRPRPDGQPEGPEELDEEEEQQQAPRAVGVVFTLGSSKVHEAARRRPDDAKDSTESKVPISALRAKFLSERREPEPGPGEEEEEEPARSKFPAVSEQRRKSSHDLMYEEMMLGCGQHPYEYDSAQLDDSSEEEEEEEERQGFEESLPLSECEGLVQLEAGLCPTTRSISVNFDLGDGQEGRPLDEPEQYGPPGSAPGSPGHPLPIVTITPPGQPREQKPAGLHRVPSVKSSHGYINNLKYKISNGSLFKYREETRAARISALVVVMGLICWTPYVYLLLGRNLPAGSAGSLADWSGLDATALGFLVLASYVTPLLFGYRSRRVKRELQRFFCFKRELSYKNNRSLMAKKVLRRRHSGATILSQFIGEHEPAGHNNATPGRYSIFNCVYGRNRWPKEKVQFVQVPETALAVETCRSSFSSGASTQISSTSTDDC